VRAIKRHDGNNQARRKLTQRGERNQDLCPRPRDGQRDDALDEKDKPISSLDSPDAGATIHFYMMAVAVDPKFPVAILMSYGAARGALVFSFLLALAERGVIIETIIAPSHTQDSIKLMRKLGFPWLVSSVPGGELFSVRVGPFKRCTIMVSLCDV
jgi:hypothetical protein